MERISQEDLELLYGKQVAVKDITILGFKNKLTFEIYDGFAYCPNYRGSEYCMKYPKVEFVEKSPEMQEKIREYLKMKEDEQITIFEILQTFNEMTRDGKRIEYDKTTKHYKEKIIWK